MLNQLYFGHNALLSTGSILRGRKYGMSGSNNEILADFQTRFLKRRICQAHVVVTLILIFFCGATVLSGPGPPRFRGFTITPRHTTFGRTSLDECPTRRRDPYLTTNNIYKKQTSMLPAEFEPAIPTSERPQTHSLDRAGTWLGHCY